MDTGKLSYIKAKLILPGEDRSFEYLLSQKLMSF